MNKFKIKRIYLENFKLIKDKLIVNEFSGQDFIVLDGPNGFGKTSIFDAIELVMTGKIHRIQDNLLTSGNDGKTDSLFFNEQGKELKIAVELSNEDEFKTILLHGTPAQGKGKRELRPENWEYFKRYLFEDFDDIEDLSSGNQITQNEINSLFQVNDLSRYFKLFYYIQQEETTHFLKIKENNRIDELSGLFDTVREEGELNKLQNFKSKIDEKILDSTSKLSQLREKKESISQEDSKGKAEKIPYENLTIHLDWWSPEWDEEQLKGLMEEISEGVEKREVYKSSIRKVIDFLNDFESNYQAYSNSNWNKDIRSIIQNKKHVIEDAIHTGNFSESFEEIKALFNKQEQYKDYLEKLSREKLLENIKSDKIDFNRMFKFLGSEGSKYEILDIIQQILDLASNEKELSKIAGELNNSRDKIRSLFDQLRKKSDTLPENECPLCGHEWETYEELIKAINKKKESISKLIGSTTNRIATVYEQLFASHIQLLREAISSYLENTEYAVDPSFFQQINIDQERRNAVISFLKWSKERKLDIEQFLKKERKATDNTEELVQKVIEFFESKLRDEFVDFDEKNFTSLFKEILDKKESNLQLINVESLEKKIKYIDQEYFNSKQKMLNDLTNEISFIENNQLSILRSKKDTMNEIIEVYKEKIKNHKRELTKSIELPFFIYSGKLLQDYQRGTGVFIKFNENTGQRANKLIFTSNSNSSHDALHSMSSGQLSALVIAFTLAMNKIYDNESTIGSIFIDDPVQTMDEINMASLVELLRNEFGDKQIILSTHEQEISAYMRFKFHEFGKNQISINMKDKQFQELMT